MVTILKVKEFDYQLKDIIPIEVPDEVKKEAERVSPLLNSENAGYNTMDGGKFKNIKGYIGQWAVDSYLNSCNNGKGWLHTYSEPYIQEQYGDRFDILFLNEFVWDVKCREWWSEDYFYNIKLLMGCHEEKAFNDKKCDYYIFTTVSRDFKMAYILGGMEGNKLWNSLSDLTDEDKKHIWYPTKGKIYSRDLTPVAKIVMNP